MRGALCAEVIRIRVAYDQNDVSLSRNLLMYMTKASLLERLLSRCREPLIAMP